MEKFLIIGGKSKLAKCFEDIFDKQSIGLSKAQCDITSEESIRKSMAKFDFDYVLNCAAITDLDECEADPKKCFDVNTAGVYLLNKLCQEKDKKLIHISSDYALNPVNNYGWSKHLAEKVVSKNFLVIRTNFYHPAAFLVKNLLKGKKTKVFENMYFNPISINNLAKEIYRLRKRKGILNLFSSKKISYLQFVHEFCRTFGIKKELIQPMNYKYKKGLRRPLSSYVKSDINLSIEKDLISFKKYYENKF